jgi:hypothetical protein
MPSRAWYVVAALVFVVGFVVFGAFLFLRLSRLDEGIEQFVVPGSAEVAIDEPGRQTIYRETGASIDGRYYGTSDLTGLEVVVTDPSGDVVELDSPAMNETYTIGGREGVAIFKFDAEEPGTYRVEAFYPVAGTGNEGVLAVGKPMVRDILLTVFGGLAIAGGAALLALAIAVVTFVRRYRATRRAASAHAPPPATP